jgi:hypothetical protein
MPELTLSPGQESINSATGDSHIAGDNIGVKLEVWSTTGYRHFPRGPIVGHWKFLFK